MQSMRWFDYVSDSGVKYAVYRDESNTRTVNSLADVGAITTNNPLPRGLHPRTVTMQYPSGAIRHMVVLTQVQFASLLIGGIFVTSNFESDDVVGTSGKIIYKTGEYSRRQPKSVDTGQIDLSQP